MTVTQDAQEKVSATQCLNCGEELANSKHALCQVCFEETPYRNSIRGSQEYGEYTNQALEAILAQGGKVEHCPNERVIIDFPKGSLFEGARGEHWIALPNNCRLYRHDGDAGNAAWISHVAYHPHTALLLTISDSENTASGSVFEEDDVPEEMKKRELDEQEEEQLNIMLMRNGNHGPSLMVTRESDGFGRSYFRVRLLESSKRSRSGNPLPYLAEEKTIVDAIGALIAARTAISNL